VTVAEAIESRTYLSAAAAGVTDPIVVLRSNLGTPEGYSSPSGAPLTPAKMRSAYGLGTVGGGSVTFGGVQGDGSGQTIAIVAGGGDPTIASDLAAFDSYWGLPAPPSFTALNATGGTTLPATADAGETSLDVEWSHVMAPGANIVLFEGNVYTDITTALHYANVSVISISYNIGTESLGYYQTPSGHTGVTVLGASGDSPSNVNDPGKEASVVSVGGTDLYLSGTSYSSETAWSSGGGGIATGIAQPTYQKVKAAAYSTQYRTTPDVSMDADPGTGVAVYDTTDNAAGTPWTAIVGGTSLATPLWAGVVAVADQGRVAAGLSTLDGYTQTLPRLYTLPSAAFHDITSGSAANAAKPGYDLATGLGSPVASQLIPDLAGADTITGRAFVDTNGDGVYDAGDTVLANTQVYVDLDGSGTLDSADVTATTDANGLYTFLDVIGGVTTTVRLATTPAGYLHTTTAAVTTAYDATESGVDIGIEKSPYAAAANPTNVTGKTTALSVTGTAPAIASTYTLTWTATTVPSGGAVSFSANGTYAARASTATFTKAGNYAIAVTIADGQGGSATLTAYVTVAATPTAVVVSPVASSVNSGQTNQLTATLVDQFGNAVSSQPTFTWTIDSGDGTVGTTGLYTAPSDDGTVAMVRATAGSYTGTATVDVLSGGFQAVDIGGPTVAGTSADQDGTFTVAGAGTGTSGTVDQLRFVYQTLPGDGSIIARVVTQQNTAAGAIAGVMIRQSLAANAANAAGALMAVTPADGLAFATRTAAGGAASVRFTTANVAPYWVKLVRSGSVLGGYYSPDGVTWTAAFSVLISMTNPAFVGLAVSSGSSGTLSTATFDHVNVSPSVYTAATASPNPVTGTSTTLSVLGYDDAGESNLTYTWAATTLPAGAAAPTYSDNGTNSAKTTTATFARAGTYVFKVTITDGSGLTATSTASVVVSPTLSAVTVTPATASVSTGQSQQFLAIGRDQFGNALATQPAITWSLANGSVGTISSTGLYAAPADTAGSATVVATSGSVTGTAAVTVTDDGTGGGTVTGTTIPVKPYDATASGWVSADVGNPTLAGSGSVLGTTYTASGSGTGLGAAVDQFQYLYQTVSGSGAVVARVATQTASVTGGFAGVMVRQSLAAGSATVAMGVTPGNGLEFAYRTATGGTLVTKFTTANVAPVWVKLVRSGSVVGGYYSADGVTWTAAFAVLATFTDPVLAGLATASGTNGALATDTFDNVAISLTGANLNVPAAGPTVGTAATATPSPVTGTTATLYTVGADAAGEASLTYAWTATTVPTGATMPTFSANRTNAAKTTVATFAAAGTYVFRVTITDGAGLAATSSVTVVVAQTPARVTVLPTTATLTNPGDTEQLTATAYDQFGKAFTAAPTLAWSVTSGSGTVSPAGGLFSAGVAGSTATVQVKAGTASASATLSVAKRPFTVFDNLTYTNSPVPAAYGLTQATVMYDGYIWSKSDTSLLYNQTDGVDASLPDEATYKQSVLSHIALQGGNLTTPGAVILDIENIDLSAGTTAQVTQNFNVLITLAQWTEQVAPKDLVGFYSTSGYGILPHPWGSAYQALATQLASTVNAFFPSMYLHSASTTHAQWASQETTLVAQAKALAPGKPVYFYLWPQDDYGTNAFMSSSEWTYELTESRTAGGAGVVMWSGSSTSFDSTQAWWAATQTFVAGVTDPVIGSVTESAASVTAGSAVTLSANTVVDAGSTVSSVTFYLDTDGVTGLGTSTDRAIGTATKSGTTWSTSFLTVGLSAGTYTIYAVATDAAGVKSGTGVFAAGVTLVVA
jgi:hypothetical protein